MRYYYNFNLKSEYKNYKNVGNNDSQIRNYVMWKSSVINKYQLINENKFFENMLRFLEKKKRYYKNANKILNIIIIPVFLFLLSICLALAATVISIGQYANSLLSDVSIVKYNLHIKFSQYNDLESRVNYFKEIGNGAYNIFLVIIIITFIYFIMGSLFLLRNQHIIDFLNDYEEIIKTY